MAVARTQALVEQPVMSSVSTPYPSRWPTSGVPAKGRKPGERSAADLSIGPVTARNRFYQVPHASGMTNALPHVRAKFRETKAEGGWGVVCTGAVSLHPSSDDSPLPFASLWDERDVRFALLVILVPAFSILIFTALGVSSEAGRAGIANLAPADAGGPDWRPHPHGLSEVLYAYSSASASSTCGR